MNFASPIRKLLVANRGEVACRVFRAGRTLGIATVGVCSADDQASLHVRRCDELQELAGTGPAAYLDIDAVVEAAVVSGADALHPGYGFLSESPELARACQDAGVLMVGPAAETLELFGDKARARGLAADTAVPVLPGTHRPTEASEMLSFWDREADELGLDAAVVIKAVYGGGGRGVRVARTRAEVERAFTECAVEARQAFGNGDLYIERFLPRAHHVEVQLVGDRHGRVAHLWDRDCSIQRRHQKLIEAAPSRVLAGESRSRMLETAVRLGAAARVVGIATVEFLAQPNGSFYFIETNPRLQVEHTVTEEVLGVDLVALQLQLVAGASLADLRLEQPDVPTPRGHAVQVRINAEEMRSRGEVIPSTGTLTEFETATGAGVRVEAAGYRGLTLNPRYDSLLAKVVTHATKPEAAIRLASHALAETRIEGVRTNLGLQRAVLAHPDFAAGVCDTSWVERNAAALLQRAAQLEASPQPPADALPGKEESDLSGSHAVRAPLGGLITAVDVTPGQAVGRGDPLFTIEAMKMQYPVQAPAAGVVTAVAVSPDETVTEGDILVGLDLTEDATKEADDDGTSTDLDHFRPDLEALLQLRHRRFDEARPDAVAKRHRNGQRTARENIDAVTDDGLLIEYGGLAVAAQRNRRELADLEVKSPADGIVTGLGRINGDVFGADRSTCAVLAYDYTVMAGTQGYYNHRKTDRLLQIAYQQRHPVILFAEGGGGRPNDSDVPVVAGLHLTTFVAMGRLSGTVPTVGIAAGRCFAGNAALLGTCDIVIATADSTIGMGGPAMIEGGGLGTYTPEEVGPITVQSRNGVVDLPVADEAEAAAVARRYLSYFQGNLTRFEVPDQRALRHVVPENRKHVYDVRKVLAGLFDVGSVLELRAGFGPAAVTALARLDGKPVGVIANQPSAGGGAINTQAADKIARFLQLCDAHSLPVVSLCDTPGFMVGPESEKQAAVRHFSRLFVLGGNMTVPILTVVLRKAYGLGAMAMAAGSFHNTAMTVSWPTGEFGGMGIEGAVRLGARDFLASISDPAERQRQFDGLVALGYQQGSAVNTARHLEIDDVIDPAETRAVIAAGLFARPAPPRDQWTNSKRRPGIDTC
ncbi:ATP-grasp domain-containing protein [Streptomyces sp. HUCO-GS316]|uniref:acetyl-CoA carboxylase family protein n=1 Tax=Streptomyces sp. HUCO-GS316 TaxID=2692198 RepID=UPI00136CA6F3|nr:carboxyl transferase domain-containing protein [Streptomyces sp. HUCO-GS316]MXM68247.1 ATP-grasp domain-containing protein [Streptomyces sp. HUCO-GS316]